jgi:hypothetical protein
MNKFTIPLKRFANEIGFNPVNIDPMGMTPRDWNVKITTQSFDAAWKDGSRVCHCCGEAVKQSFNIDI